MATLSNALWHLKFVAKKPGVLPRIAWDYFSVRILGRKRLRTIDWAITYRCNAQCTMCSAKHLIASKKSRSRKELTAEQMGMVWEQAVELGAIHTNLTGGEPTMRDEDEVANIVRILSRRRALVSMVTNALRMTREKLQKFRDAGLDTLQLSIESMDPKAHDEVRGIPGGHEKVMQTFRWAKELGLSICLSTVLSAFNFEEVRRIIDFGREQKVFVLLNPLSASGEKAGDYEGSISGKKAEYYELLKQGHVRADTILNFRGGSGCPGGVERLYMTPYGDVMTCPHVQVSYGNVLEEPLAVIWERIAGFPYLREYQRDCRHVFNEHYIEKIVRPTQALTDLPVSILEHPVAKDPEIADYLKRSDGK